MDKLRREVKELRQDIDDLLDGIIRAAGQFSVIDWDAEDIVTQRESFRQAFSSGLGELRSTASEIRGRAKKRGAK